MNNSPTHSKNQSAAPHMGTQFSNLRYALESDRAAIRVAQHHDDEGDEPNAVVSVTEFFDSPPNSYDRDCEIAIRLEPGATEPLFEHDLSAGANLHSLNDVAPAADGSDSLLVPTGVAFGLPAYLSGVVHGFGVETAFLNAYDRTPLVVRLYAGAYKAGVQRGDAVAKVAFVPIVRPRFVHVHDDDHDNARGVARAAIVAGDHGAAAGGAGEAGGARNPLEQERERCSRAQNDDAPSGGDVERV